MFQPVVTEKSSKSQRIVAQIRELFSDGKIKPGDKLPSERELAGIFNVSRTSVREAFRTMAALDMVEIKIGSGVYVKEAMLHSVINNVADNIVISREEVNSLFEIRKVLETHAAAWAARRATEKEIDDLAGLIQEVKKASLSKKIDLSLAMEYDKKFHSTIIKVSHNQVLVKIMSAMFDVLDRVRTKIAVVPGRAVQSINDHEAIAQAIAAKDPVKAMEAMHNHIEGVEKSIGNA
ncbi:MAG: FadR/GntR family transcriptional regulator [Bacillota bacterium]